MLVFGTAALTLAGSPPVLALTPEQGQSLQQAAVGGETALRAAVLEIAVADLAAGRPIAGVAEEIIGVLMSLSPDPRVQADAALIGILALAEAADRQQPGGSAATDAAAVAMSVALSRGGASRAFLQALVEAMATAVGGSGNAYAGILGAALQTALETKALPPETQEAVAQLAQGSGLLTGTSSTDETAADQGGSGQAGTSEASAFWAALAGGLPEIPGTVSSDRPGDSSASPN
jgi:hypothetical protein